MYLETFGICLILLYLMWMHSENSRNPNGPPGPMRYPPFGNLIQLVLKHRVIHFAMHKMSKKHGDVMSLKMGFMETVIISSYQAFRQVFSKEESLGRECSGIFLERNLGQNIGLAMAQPPFWNESRHFCKSVLKPYGFENREAMKNLLLEELSHLFTHMEEEANLEGKIYFDSDYFHGAFLNIMCTLMIGKRFDYEDQEFLYMLECLRDFEKNGMLSAGIIMSFPFMKYILPGALGYNSQLKGIRGFRKVALKCLRERSGNTNKIATCFIDDYIKKMDEYPKDTTYSVDNFIVLFADILQGGTDTSSNTINFILLHLMANPEIQKTLSKEIEHVVGYDRLPILEDKYLMPYTQALIHEGLRWNRVFVFGAPRKVLKDFTYRKYRIKKDTVLMYNMHSIVFDEEFWGDPQVFRPERFFASDGSLDQKKLERVIAFGTGKRDCFGQGLARDSLFIFVTTLCQRYKFSLPAGSAPNLEPVIGMSLYPAPYHGNVTKRNP